MNIRFDTGEQGSTVQQLNKYLTFMLADEEYGLEILKVREIIGLMDVTRVPRMPAFIRGVINLRGRVIPVIDLRLKFNMDAVEDTRETCIIVVDLEEILTGIVVDSVSEVMDIPAGDIEEAPDFGVSVDTEFIMGVGKADDKVVMLLDIRKALEQEELEMVASAGRAGAGEEGADV